MSLLECAPRDDSFEAVGVPRARPVPDGESPDLIERARRGETAAFEALYRANVGRVYAVCLRIHSDPDRAEEATQEAFIRAWKKIRTFEGRSAFSSWLHRLAVNVVLDQKRAAKRRGREASIDDEGASVTEGLPARKSTPDVGLDLERALAALPAGARKAFVLHDIEGYRHREIAEMTGTAEGTWKAQLNRARRLLREALER